MKERVLFRKKKERKKKKNKVGLTPSYAAGVCLYVCVCVVRVYIYTVISAVCMLVRFNGSSSKSVSLTLVDRAILDEIN